MRVLASAMEKAGTYRFVLHFYDDYADSYKNHQVKAALERNQPHKWYPITYHDGEYDGSRWHVAWCRAPRQVSKKTGYEKTGTIVIDKVKELTPSGSGKVAAGVNGGFFYGSTILGEVGTGSGWEGSPMEIRRWAFGMKEKGWDHSVERMVKVSGNQYAASSDLKKKYPYGLSGIGVLIYNGKALFVNDKDKNKKVDDDAWFMDDDDDGKVDEDPRDEVDNDNDGKIDEDPPWPNVLDKRARTALAWGRDKTGNNRYFFLVVVEETKEKPGWTWNETVQFCKEELPKIVRRESPHIEISIYNAVMLDGGSSVKFLWRHARKKGTPSQENKPKEEGYQSTSQKVFTYVVAWADSYVCQFCDK